MEKRSEAARLRSLSSLILIVLLVGASFASQVLDPTDIGGGARPLGMGKAFTGIADDGSAIFTNPAGLSQNKSLTVISMAGSLMTEVPYTIIGASYPALNGTIGIGYVGLGISGINETILVNGTPEITGAQGSYTNSAINLSYATELKNVSYGIIKSPDVGATLKIISQGLSGGSFEGGGGTGFDLDLGARSRLTEDMTAGFVVKNIIPGNNFKSDEIPMVIQGGVTKAFNKYNLLTALDAEYNRTILFHAGCEWNPIRLLKLRLGLDQKPDAGSTTTNLAAGLGVSFGGFAFDYAYHTYAGISDLSTHYFSIGYVGEARAEEAKPVTKPSIAPAPIMPAPMLAPVPTPPASPKKVQPTPTKKPVKKTVKPR
jgi:hypothetical protein